ncbi:MAG: DUF3179 domain-containing protein [Anaerolineales bacterium]|nr:DUF3179 domain-containing protein [Anaerolineales bacterium]
MKFRNISAGVLFSFLFLVACVREKARTDEQNSTQMPEEQDRQVQIAPENSPESISTLELGIAENGEAFSSTAFEQSYGPNPISERDYSQYEIVTLLPRDAIPALTHPQYYDVKQADDEYHPDEFVLGIEFNGDARAYSIGLLSRHEIVNDTVGGIHLAVTW